MRKATTGSAVCVLTILMAGFAGATPVTVDHIVYPELTATNPGAYAGTVDMTLSDHVLTITLTNTSTGLASPEGADNLLTGIGFDLPGNLRIAGGSVFMASGWNSGDLFNVTPPPGWSGNLSSEWGYDTQGIQSGAFQDPDLMDGNFVDNAVSVMESQTTNRFANGSLGQPGALGGPDFGLLSEAVSGAILGVGNEGIQWSVVIQLTLRGSVPADLIAQIERGDVVLSFGSPTAAPVPEPSTLALLCLGGLFGLAGLTRRKK